MLQALAPIFIAVAAVLGCVIPFDKDPRRGREATMLILVCLACATLGVIGELA